MISESFSYNPFSLSTAHQAYHSTSTPIVKAGKVTIGAIYDIFVKNPYDLTIGNAKTLAQTEKSLSLKTKVGVYATIFFGSCYALMLHGTSIHLQGRALAGAAAKTNLTAIGKVAEVLKEIGKRVFITGAVPVYGLFYALPKYIVLSIPKALTFVATKIAAAAKLIFHHVLHPLWTKVLAPAGHAVLTVIRFVATKIGETLQTMAKIVSTVAKAIFNHVMVPLWKHVIAPMLRGTVHVIKFVATKSSEILKAVSVKVFQASQWVFNHVLAPLWDNVIVPVAKTMANVIVYLAKAVAHAAAKVASMVAKSAQWFFSHVMVPIWNRVVIPTVNFLNNYVVQPLTAALYAVAVKIGQAFTAVVNNAIIPAAKVVADVSSTTMHAISSAFSEVGSAFTGAFA